MDNMAIVNPILAHILHGQFGEQRGPDDVDVEHCAPGFWRALQHPVGEGRLCAVHHNAHFTQRLHHTVEHFRNLKMP